MEPRKILVVGTCGIGSAVAINQLKGHSCNVVIVDDITHTEHIIENTYELLPELQDTFIPKENESYKDKYVQKHHRKSKW